MIVIAFSVRHYLKGHEMERHLDIELKSIKEDLLKMAGLVEQAIDRSIKAIKNRDEDRAQKVIDQDREIDAMEIQIENDCFTILARYQPVAADLRFIMASIKINNDLERMGDHAVNIAQKAQSLAAAPSLKPLIDIPLMADIVQGMLRDSLNSFVNGDVEQARLVCEKDDDVDALEVQVHRELLTYMMEDHRNISRALQLTMIAKNLERIADLSTNICEEVIFMVEGRTIKHHSEDLHLKSDKE